MSLPTTTGTRVLSQDFNSIQSIVADIRGTSENGYGLTVVSPTVVGSLISEDRNNILLKNVSSVYTHITNLVTSTNTVTSSATNVNSVVRASFYNQIKAMVDYCLANRYTCHPSQLQNNGAGRLIYDVSTSSTRTLPWGANGITSITHKVKVAWVTRLSALYYFNNGNHINWLPNFTGPQINDLDITWANWINYINVTPNQVYKYNRANFVSGSTVTRTYTSGTLVITVVAVKSPQETSVDFTVTYQNTDAPLLVVIPAAWAYRIDL